MSGSQDISPDLTALIEEVSPNGLTLRWLAEVTGWHSCRRTYVRNTFAYRSRQEACQAGTVVGIQLDLWELDPQPDLTGAQRKVRYLVRRRIPNEAFS